MCTRAAAAACGQAGGVYTTYGCLVGSSLPGAVAGASSAADFGGCAGASSAALQHFWWGVQSVTNPHWLLHQAGSEKRGRWSSILLSHEHAYSCCCCCSSWYVRCGSLSGGCCQGVHVHPHGGLTAAQQSWHCTKGVWGGGGLYSACEVAVQRACVLAVTGGVVCICTTNRLPGVLVAGVGGWVWRLPLTHG